jgi:hypothetical protein
MLGFDPKGGRDDPSQMFLGFLFDEDARGRTIRSLEEELPGRLRGFADRIDVASLYASIANETPANMDILRQALLNMHEKGEIEIRDKDAMTSRKRGVQSDRDVILVKKEKTILLPFERFR